MTVRATFPAQRADTIEPGAERWRRPRRHRAALGKRRNNPQAPNGALQNEAGVRSHVSAVSSMKISQEANIVRNTRRVDPCCAPVGALMVLGTVYLGRRSAAAPLRLPQAGLFGPLRGDSCSSCLRVPKASCHGPAESARMGACSGRERPRTKAAFVQGKTFVASRSFHGRRVG